MKKAKFNFEEPDLSRYHILTYDELLRVNGGSGSDSDDNDDETVGSESGESSDEGAETATESTTGEESVGEPSADPTSESTSSGTNSESESGGHEIENTVEAVANAEVGDTLTRDDGTQVTITEGDITWAQEHCDSYGKNGEEAENKEGDLTTKEDEENSDSSLENESNSANSNSTANNTAEEKSEQGTANSTKESEVETTASGNKTSSTESSQQISHQVPSNSNEPHCDINSYNVAVDRGVQNPGNWDGNAQCVDEIYRENYADVSTATPQAGTHGYGFYDNDGDGSYDHMYYYDYSNGGDSYHVWNSDGIAPVTEHDWSINGTAVDNSVYAPLN